MNYLDFVKKDKRTLAYAGYFAFLCIADCWMSHRLIVGERYLLPSLNDVLICILLYGIIIVWWLGILGIRFNTKIASKYNYAKKLSPEDRYTLLSFSFLAEIRSYILSATIAIYSLGAAYAFSGATFSLPCIIVMIIAFVIMLGGVLRQPEHFLQFLSKEYCLLFAECFYRNRNKDVLKKIEELSKL